MNDLSYEARLLPGKAGAGTCESNPPSSWDAFLHLAVNKTTRGSRLVSSNHSGPLYVQKPFYPEGPELAHVYILHPPGGLVSGDNLDIRISAQDGSCALYTTPGAGRVYRARQDQTPQKQRVTLRIEQYSSIEWLPLETIVYPGACGQLSTRIDMAADSHFIGWEITCLGLPASNEPFDRGQFTQRLEIFQDGLPLLIENLPLQATDKALLNGAAGMQARTVMGLMVAGPVSTDLAETLLPKLREIEPLSSALLAVTAVHGFLLLRYLGDCSSEARALLTAAWRILRPEVLQRPACDPRIWAC